jgi:hypothetical protein
MVSSNCSYNTYVTKITTSASDSGSRPDNNNHELVKGDRGTLFRLIEVLLCPCIPYIQCVDALCERLRRSFIPEIDQLCGKIDVGSTAEFFRCKFKLDFEAYTMNRGIEATSCK